MDLDDAELETQLRDALHRAAQPVHGEGIFRETIHNEVARRQATRRRSRWTTGMMLGAAVAAAAAVSVFVLTRPDTDRVDIDDSVVTQPTTPPTTAAPSTTAPTDGGAGAPVETTTTAPSTTTAPPPVLPGFPPEDPLGHGKSTWGLYLEVLPAGPASVDSPEFQAAQQAAIDAGYSQGEGYSGIGCDEGAEEALGVDPDAEWISPAVYFATEAQANQAKAAFEARGQSVDGIAHVITYCLD